MAKIDLGNVLTAAIASAATQMAASPNNNLPQKDIPQIVDTAKEVAAPVLREAQARIDYITNNESLPTSYSFTGGLTAVLGAIGTVTTALYDGYDPASDNAILIPALVTVAGCAWVLYGRLVRNKPIGS